MKIDAERKLSGILVPVFALRRHGDLGIGDTIAVIEALDFCKQNLIAALQTLPINETSDDNSPYNAISSMALEPCLLAMSPDMVPGLSVSDVDEEIAASSFDASAEFIDYAAVKGLKIRILRRSFDNYMRKPDSAFDQFCKRNDRWLSPYAVFRAIMAESGSGPCWTYWSDEQKSYESALAWIKCSERAADLKQEIAFWSYVQWVADSQWRSVKEHADRCNVRLMGDIPFGVSRYSVDVWHERRLFDLEWSGGAPPEPVFHTDLFTKNWGQNWGIPLYDWRVHAKDGYAWWRSRVERLLEHFHDFRIDHVLGFFRVYAFPWIPERNDEFVELTEAEAAAITGGKLPGFRPRPDEPEKNALLNKKQGVAILEAVCEAAGSGYIVAEDLGLLIPEYLRPALHDLGMAGFAIPIFERIEKTREFQPIDELHPLSLATYATHDHQPLASFYDGLLDWWHGPDGEEGWKEVRRLMKLLDLDPDNPPEQYDWELQKAFMKALMDSPCWMAVFMVTDLIGSRLRFNQPGISGSGCWTQRLPATLAALQADQEAGRGIAALKELIESTGREPAAIHSESR